MRWVSIKLTLLLSLLCFHPLRSEEATPKILVLIISSDNFPGSPLVYPYKQLQAVWRSYMHLDPEHVEAYFIRANPDLDKEYQLVGDVLWSKTIENVKPGILNKTVLSLKYFLPRLQEFDFVLRTNLSSFYVMPKLLNFLKNLPKTGAYCASGDNFGSGCGYILSSDIARMIGQDKKYLLNNGGDDDVVVGYFLRSKGISLLPAPRKDLLCLEDWLRYKERVDSNDFHFRVKNLVHERRAIDDILIYSELLSMYYDIKLRLSLL